MLRRAIIGILFLAFCVVWGAGVSFGEGIGAIEPVKKEDRILILAPHPDDEAICCAGLIQQARKAGAEIKIVYLTNGDNNQFAFIVYEKRFTFKPGEFIHMGEVRRKEAISAMKLLGIDENKLIFLGYPDFGTFTIFNRYWQAQKPFRSLLTRVSSVPYKEDASFGAPYTGESILNDLEKILLSFKPTKIFVSHPADVNVDHKSLYLFLQAALRDLSGKIPEAKIYPYLVHCVGWPIPRHYHPELNLEPPRKFMDSQMNWLKLDLTPEELELKRKVILCYKSQTESSAFYLFSFARKNELFGDYPEIELKRLSSLKERAPEFFGFSKLFPSSQEEGTLAYDSLMDEDKDVSYAVVDNCLLIRLGKDKKTGRKLSLMFYIFGSSEKSPFASMPKIRIITKGNKFKAYDGAKAINPEGILLDLSPNDVVLRIPLNILGDPDFILTSVKVYAGKLPLNTTGFRKIVIK